MNDELILGIDEAGLGPVFGPMIVSGVLIRRGDEDYLRGIGVKDSKMFGSGLKAHEKREKVWESARELVVDHIHVVIEAAELDEHNMYDLHINATRSILNGLKWRQAGNVYVEQLGGMGQEKFRSRIGFWHDGFVYESKADTRYTAVSLASIKAKISRDRIISRLCHDLNEEYVSGYPNAKTEEFLRRYYRKNGCLPPGTRKSRNWAPINEMAGRTLF